MANKHSPDDNLPPLFLDKEDREGFARQRKSASGQATSTKASSAPPAKSSGGGRSIAWFALLVALSGYGGSYFLHEQLLMRTDELQSATSRIEELERQLSITGEELGESSGSLQAQLAKLNTRTDTLWTEMDKLWASAWRKNQAQIKSVESKLGTQQKEISATAKNADNIKKSLWKVANDVENAVAKQNTLESKLNDNTARITDTNDNLLTIETTLEGIDESTVMARQDAQKRDTTLAALTQQLRELTAQNQRLQKQVIELIEWRQNQDLTSSRVSVTTAN